MLLPSRLRSLETHRLLARAHRQPCSRRQPLLEALEGRELLSVLTVSNTNDSGAGSLRAAVTQASSDGGGDTIVFSSLFKTPQTITLTSGQLELTGTVAPTSITGPGANLLSVSGGGSSRVFQVDLNVTASILGLTITGGNTGSFGSGGGINNSGTLMLTNSTLSGNSAVFAGGGILNSGTATLTNSTLSDNLATGEGGSGGGISNSGTVTLTNSTLSGNSAVIGGGIYNNGTAMLTNSTLSGNLAVFEGGGIYNYLGIEGTPGTATLTNTIVGGNTLSDKVTPSDLAGHPVEAASTHNLMGPGGSGGLSNGVNGNIVVASAADLHLGPLANNGGPTQTIALLTGSPAINAGTSGPGIPTTDQRGFARSATAPDIGAYEVSHLIIVTTAVDEDSGTADPSVGTGTSLREAINLANSVAGTDTIDFDIPGAGAHTINLLSALPNLTDPVIIDATTQPGFDPQTAVPVIELNGVNAGATASAFVVAAGSSTIKGFLIDRFQGGIVLSSDGNLVADNDIGTDAAGTPGLGNQGAGIGVTGTNNTIGGTAAGAGNVISGNGNEGIFIRGGGNLVQGNKIGTNAAGTAARGNGLSGITLQNSADNRILNNIISGNGIGLNHGVGIVIVTSADSETAGATQNLIQGNLIGTDATGEKPLPNFSGGIGLLDAVNNTIGGTAPGQGNLISGNGGDGILGNPASNNLIAGNTIGLSSSGAPLGNSSNGISLTGGMGNTITGNVISANGVGLNAASIGLSTNLGHGIGTQSASDNLIIGNTIGLSSTGAPRGNFSDGISVIGGMENTITGNVVSANGSGMDAAGINLTGNATTGSTTANVISNNLIGTSADGKAARGNSLHGIFLDDGVSNNMIGPGNTISANGSEGSQGVGVYIFGPATFGNLVLDNRIGTDASGTSKLAKSLQFIGVLINEAHTNVVQGNLISGNQSIGVNIADAAGATASGNLVQGNEIGTNFDGTAPVPNGQDGVFINNAPNNTIIGNLISGNGTPGPPRTRTGVGIQLFGQLTTGNVIQGNKIGTDAAGNPTLPNLVGGIFLDLRSRNNPGVNPGQANQGQTAIILGLFGPTDTGLMSSAATSRRNHRGKATQARTKTVARAHPAGPSAHSHHHASPSHRR
jgi:CSLREA domain-containing protein